MTFGAQSYDTSGVLQWDTRSVVGSFPADVRFYPAGSPGGTLSYPQFAGYTAYILDCAQGSDFLSLSTSAGYPVVTVSSPSSDMVYVLMVY